MPSKATWFLPPDFTFLENGLIQLGTVITQPQHPTQVLLHPDELSTASQISLPPVQVLVETNHSHGDHRSNTIGGNIWGNFVQLASASLKLDTEWTREVQYGVVDHEVRSFARPFTKDTLAAILSQPAVRDHMNSGLWGKRPVYIVSGVRITKMGMSVTTVHGTSRGGGISGSGPVPAGAPIEIGAGIHGDKRRDKTDSYETAPRIVFAYRLNAIRQRRDGGVGSDIFSHRTAFMTGGTEENLEIEVVEVDRLAMQGDLEGEEEDKVGFIERQVGETDVCISFG